MLEVGLKSGTKLVIEDDITARNFMTDVRRNFTVTVKTDNDGIKLNNVLRSEYVEYATEVVGIDNE